MKSILPYLSAIALAAIMVAVMAPIRPAGGQEGDDALTTWGQFDEPRDAAQPYRAVATDEASVEAVDPAQLPNGQQLLLKAMQRLQRHESVYARLRHQVSLEGNQLFGVGSYWQQGRGDQLQVYLELQIAGQEASLLQVANDRFLWVDRRLPLGRTVTRFDLRALRAEQKATNIQPDALGDKRPAGIDDGSLLFGAQSGGLPGLFASLLDKFEFMPPQSMRLTLAPPLVAEAMEVPVFAVVGHWKPAKLTALIGGVSQDASGEKQESANGKTIPDRFPQEVLLLLGQADLFPYRVEYRRLETPRPSSVGNPEIVYHLSAAPLVVLEFADVAFGVPIAAGQFDYAPPQSVDWKDQTAALIERLRKERQLHFAGSMAPVGGVSDADSGRAFK